MSELKENEFLFPKFFNDLDNLKLRKKLEDIGFEIIEDKKIDFKVKLSQWIIENPKEDNKYFKCFYDPHGVIRLVITWHYGWVILFYDKDGMRGKKSLKEIRCWDC